MIKIFKKSFLCLSIFVSLISGEPANSIVIVTASYRNAKFIEGYFKSIINQTLPFKKLIYIADNDYAPNSDGTGILAQQIVEKYNIADKAIVVRNKNRQLALQNIYKSILTCDDEDTIALLDGDDELGDQYSLEKVFSMYLNPSKEIWATYGNFKSLSTGQPWYLTQQIPPDIIATNSIRKWMNGPTHLKTFKAWVFKNIKIQDFFYEGDFCRTAYDVAMFEPMYEMLADRYDFTQDVLYVYNDLNPINDGKVNRELQLKIDHFIRAKPPYKKLEKSLSGRIDNLKKEGLLTADLIVFADEINQDEDIKKLKSKITGFNDVYFITKESMPSSCIGELCHNYKVLSIDHLPRIIQSLKSNYVLFVEGLENLSTINIEDALKWLETTHAHAFYCGMDKNMFDKTLGEKNILSILISLDDESALSTYAWQYQNKSNLGLTKAMTLMRKSDLSHIQNLSLINSVEELNEQWNKSLRHDDVGLFYRGNI